nr:zinc finger, BED-type, phospholipase-like, homeodomain-like protein [Tanacetum cinerariifolium]
MLKDAFKSGGRNYKHYIRICEEAKKPAKSANWDVPTRWNSIYHMFQCSLKQKATLMYFHDLLANRERQQHTSTLENALDFEDEIMDAEVQDNEATPLSDKEIALDAASEGIMASGSGGEEQDINDLTHHGIDD